MSLLSNPLFPPTAHQPRRIPSRRGDTRDGRNYVMSSEAELRVNVALATGRPLLVMGGPGTGKSSLAAYVAQTLGWRFQEFVVTSRTESRDLLWTYDPLARLNEVHSGGVAREARYYVEPGPLWWALAPEGAAVYGRGEEVPRSHPFDAMEQETLWPLNADARDIVLIDEIDKADPDVPNDLLVAIGSGRFTVRETHHLVTASQSPVLMFTTNGERELPPAFLRRCVVITLRVDDVDLTRIGMAHFPFDRAIVESLAGRVAELRAIAHQAGERAPSIAEFLDAVAACKTLGLDVNAPAFEEVMRATLVKAPTDSRPAKVV